MKSIKELQWPIAPEWAVQSAVLPLRSIVIALDWTIPWPTMRRTKLSQSQVWLIAEKEIATNVLNFKIPAAFSLLLVLILASFFLMSADYQKRLENWSINRAAQTDKLFSGITSNYRSADGQMSMRATSVRAEPSIRKPFLLSIFAKGLDSLMERSVEIGENDLIPPATSISFGSMQERNRNLMLFAPPDFLYDALVSQR